ncbi:MAG: ATP-binding cassette domain-containing protein [Candidatus Caenarcaniphilales bacterium]|nr:ATP-binding cassette domain-containing protein [Candidatus Caenarcaniphilales bacterium]
MITVSKLTKSFTTKILFENVSVIFSEGNRYGLTGPNGAGKSTFMKILQNAEQATSGEVSIPNRVGILRQDQFMFDKRKIIDTVLMGNKILWSALEERDQLCSQTELTDEMGMRLAELEVTIGEEDGYTAEYKAAKLLEGIGIPEEKHYELMETLPTDLKFRVLIVQALFGEPNALLLDEPTNYLDMQSIQWLENNLLQYKGTLIVISHDRHFLNSVCTHIADIDYETIVIYPGNYDAMVIAKVQAREQLEAQNKAKSKKIEQLQDFVNKFGAGTRSSQAQSRKKEIERLQITELKKSNIQRPFIRFEIEKPSGREALKVKNISKMYEQPDGSILEVINNLSFEILRGDKVGVVGNNGLGKTTLLRMIYGDLNPDEGSIQLGYEVSTGYFPQDYKSEIQSKSGFNAFEWLEGFSKEEGSEVLRNYLGRMLFSGDDALKKVDSLSGGESARLLIAKLMLLKNNFLILDEPTNHLDIEAVSALSEGIKNFPGTVIFVSHDRDLISNAANKIISFKKDSIEFYPGSYDEYLFSSSNRDTDNKTTKHNTKKSKNKKSNDSVYEDL